MEYNLNGRKILLKRHTSKPVQLNVKSSIYVDEYMPLDKTAKTVLNAMLKYIDDDMNTIQMNGETLEAVLELTELTTQSVRNALVRLHKAGLAERTNMLQTEYIVNPVFATKGDEAKIWYLYQKIEHKGSVPSISRFQYDEGD